MTFVLVHGGGCGARCWLPVVSKLCAPAITPELPGRDAHPGDELRIADFVDAVVADIEAADVHDAVLVGHSMAGLSIPSVLERVEPRIRHVVFISCAVPVDGASLVSTLGGDAAAAARETDPEKVGRMDDELLEAAVMHDMDESQQRFMKSIVVREPQGPITDTFSGAGLRSDVPRTWIRLLQDRIFPPEVQDEFARRSGCESIVDLDAGHMAMISRPDALAGILNQIHGQTG